MTLYHGLEGIPVALTLQRIPFNHIFSVDVINAFAACRCRVQQPGLEFRVVALCQPITNQSPGSVSGLIGTDIPDNV